MGLSYVVIDQKEVLGKVWNQSHIRSDGPRNNRGAVSRVETEIFQMNSEKMGMIEVRVPSGGAPKAMRYNAEVLLANPRVSFAPNSQNLGRNGEVNRIINDNFYLLADRVEVKGGQQ
ncbi:MULTISPECIES: DUF961 family protein [Enterococcus]|uniref:Bacterial protein of uncharacterized function (DUF961) n=1 Tax=Enterococcus gallinarum TaxID=1353 RepID=A0A376H397_ENTGA|nr:DUF961 family protein [Enterococcus gallinarum]EGO8423957.1 DUF961 domain-containing protein [Enterococcus faecalis]OJG48038.1 hypothetical protein RV03_GL001485 [Enterococcus gallinarum]STD72731.1 Bacterial protein of uncharacterised function (DUF961) [Enterococcus gallinarum]STD82639.1 Bacterial protein of uncharacterised function (DUF961) [Enterococcus gallinarum]